MDILDFVLLQDYRLQFDQTTMGIVSGNHRDFPISAPYYTLPLYLGYLPEHDVYLEYEALIPGAVQHTLVYSIHDMQAHASALYHVTGIFDAAKEVFIVHSVLRKEDGEV